MDRIRGQCNEIRMFGRSSGMFNDSSQFHSQNATSKRIVKLVSRVAIANIDLIFNVGY